MKYFALIAVALLLCSGLSYAQPGISWGLGANVSFPSSDLGDQASTGYGGTGLVKFGLIPLIDITGGIEYVSFTTKDLGQGGESSAHAWGYMVGGRVNLFVIAYGGVELGGYSFSTKVEVPNIPSAEGTNTEFFYAPMIGVNLGMFDAGVRYVVANSLNFVSIRGMIWF